MSTMRARFSSVALVLAVLLLAHQLVYLIGYGWASLSRALSDVGHDTYWLLLAAAVGAALMIAALAGFRRWLTLRGQLRRLPHKAPRAASIDWTLFRSTMLRLAPRLALYALALFFVQENLEHYTHHAGHVPGMGIVFGGEYIATLPVFALVGLAVAAVASLLKLGLAALARVVERATQRRPERKAPRPCGRLAPVHGWYRFAPDLGRAPPRGARA